MRSTAGAVASVLAVAQHALLGSPMVHSFMMQSTPIRVSRATQIGSFGVDDVGPESSRMNEFVADFLDSIASEDAAQPQEADGSKLDVSDATHMIAIPVGDCHELMIELESVQRAILYHCPILADACIVPAVTRLPLLYVRGASSKAPHRVTSEIKKIVRGVVQQQFFDHLDEASKTKEMKSGSDDDENDNSNENDKSSNMDFTNADGTRPLLMTFATLEIDGENHEILNTVGDPENEGTRRLCSLVSALQVAFEQNGFKVFLPNDPHPQAIEAVAQMDGVADTTYRPRIPFMQLPKEFNDNINRFKHEKEEITDEEFQFLTSDQGGNGISPLFWANWWDDTFGRSVRMCEIAIYPRTAEDRILQDHDMFLFPHEMVALPHTENATLKAQETKFEEYQMQRLEEERQKQEAELLKETSNSAPSNNPISSSNPNETPDVLMKKTRQRLEKLYQESASEGLVGVGDDPNTETVQDAAVVNEQITGEHTSDSNVDDEDDEDDEDEEDEEILLPTRRPQTASGDDFIEDWTKQRIRLIMEAREATRKQVDEVKDMPPIEENPVFQKYKEGKLSAMAEPTSSTASSSSSASSNLPPYPSREHFVGFWEFLSSPTGFTSSMDCENIILRVDGRTAGGPILDRETKQRSSGGTWKLLVDESNPQGGPAHLRIRLVVPPQKQRILVMEGTVTRVRSGMTMNAFGIPIVEERAKSAKSGEDVIYCHGKVHMEDAVTGKNKEEIGEFSMSKLATPNEGDYVVTVPQPVRNQD